MFWKHMLFFNTILYILIFKGTNDYLHKIKSFDYLSVITGRETKPVQN